MSVPIIENWSRIAGDILGIRRSADLEDFSEVEMLVRQVEPVDDFPNLLSGAEGSRLTVHFPSELIVQQGLAAGSSVSCWVRKAGLSRCFVHRAHVRRLESGGGSGQNHMR